MSAERVAFRADELIRRLGSEATEPVSRPRRCAVCLGPVQPLAAEVGVPRYWPATCEKCGAKAKVERDAAPKPVVETKQAGRGWGQR